MKSQPSIGSVFNTLAIDLGLEPKDREVIAFRGEGEGTSFFTKTLPLLAKALDRGLATSYFRCPTNFKKLKNTALPAMLGSQFRKVFSPQGVLLEDACPVAVYVIRQFCFFYYKADISYSADSENAVINNFVQTEEFLSGLKIADDALTRAASLVVGSVFSSFVAENIVGKHGPGVTANVPVSEKFEARLSPNLPVVRSFGEHFFFNNEDGMTRLDRYPVYKNSVYFTPQSVARVILVPKDSRGPRLISCEPWENQFIQQGIRVEMERLIQSSPITGGHVNFTDQTINQRLAVEASMTQEWSTLDLKDASDRVSLRLVKLLFCQVPSLLQSLLDSRSTHTALPDGRVVGLSKFAPMGSAVCFTVLSTVVYALVYTYLLGLTGDSDLARDSVYVYGDDLIVRTCYAEDAMKVLERYGLLVNRDKSFINSPFAESCGVDAFKGNVVTPIRVRKWEIPVSEKGRKTLGKRGQSVAVSSIKTAQLLSASGLGLTAEIFYSFAERNLGLLPYSSSNSPYLGRWTWKTSLIPEMNIQLGWTRWKREVDIVRYPLGYSMRAIGIRAVSSSVHTSAWGHMQRTWPSLGCPLESSAQQFGVFNLPRDWALESRYFDHYAMT